jgi:uncharacterized protein YdhG (YjbR/CyaY superfamily)
MAKTDYTSVDDYIAAQPTPEARSVLERVRETIRRALPRAAEGISYQIPVYRLDGRMVLYFAGFQHHYSIYPATARVLSALEKELSGRIHSKATIRFSFSDVVPARLISRIAKVRAAEAAEVEKERAKKPDKKNASKKTLSKSRRKRPGRR